jgi:uncharacterized protein YndB with AHSA1/START domain
MSTQGIRPGDHATVSVSVAVDPEEAFRIFTEEIDQWWRGGLRYRIGKNRSVIHLEPKVGGRLFESFEGAGGPRILETGRVTVWEPPSRLVLEWRAANFAASEKTEVLVLFVGTPSGTLVTVKHRGWADIRPDHPARHGLDVRAFLRMMGLWWGDLMTALREHAARGSNAPGGEL